MSETRPSKRARTRALSPNSGKSRAQDSMLLLFDISLAAHITQENIDSLGKMIEMSHGQVDVLKSCSKLLLTKLKNMDALDADHVGMPELIKKLFYATVHPPNNPPTEIPPEQFIELVNVFSDVSGI
eukprot:186607-Hanusia_phi.AAC.1